MLRLLFQNRPHRDGMLKVRAPRLDGAKNGIFATRAPMRPNAIGLTVVSIVSVEGSVLHIRCSTYTRSDPCRDFLK